MMRRHSVLSGLVLLAALASPMAGQSVLASRGLGYPLEPMDARARAMGGLTVGAPGSVFSVVNPAMVSGIPAPAASITYQHDWYDATGTDLESSGGTARFPQIVLAFPIRGNVAGSISYGSLLDQNWRATITDSVDLVTGPVQVVDRLVSKGGVARLRGGLAYRVGSRLAVGVAGELYTGAVQDTLSRQVGGLSISSFPAEYTFSGAALSAGIRWNPLAALQLTGAVTSGGTLTGQAEDSASDRREYSLPLTLDASAAARVARQLELAAGIHWAGWSDAGEELSDRGGAQDALTLSGGIEYSGLSVLRTPVPLRVGARVNQLPFRWDEDEFTEERAITAGFGLVLARGAAQLDFGGERGTRGGDGAGFEEPYWRATATFSILGR